MQFHPASASLDPWTASSLLQKAIRRGEVEHALRAGLTLHRQRGAGIWRRLMIIAYEDVGIGNLDLVADITTLSLDLDARRRRGTDEQVITALIHLLADAPKDRSTDYLICAAKQHPDYEIDRQEIAGLTTQQQIGVALDGGQSVMRRAIASWYVSGVNGGGPQVLSRGDLRALLAAFDARGFQPELSHAIVSAARKIREPIVVMLPLLCSSLACEEAPLVRMRPVPAAPLCRGVPVWAFDKHTALGKRAIAEFSRKNEDVDSTISEHVPDFRRREVAEMACFYADAVPTARQLMWSRSAELEALGLEVDMVKVGCPKAGIGPIMAAIRKNLGHLNEIRCQLFRCAS